MKNIRQIVFVCIGILMILGCVVLIIVKKKDKGERTIATTTFQSSEIQKLTMKVGACQVNIVEGEGSTVLLNCDGFGKYDVSTSFENGELTIRRNNNNSINFHLFGINLNNNGDKVMTLTVPKGTIFEDVNLDFGAAEVSIQSLHSKKLSVTIGAGQLTADELIAENDSKIEVGAGSLVIDYGSLNNASMECGVGELKLNGKVLGRSTVECGVGSVSLKLSDVSEDDYFGHLDCGLGSLSFGESKIKGSGKKDYGVSSAANELDAKCGLGEVIIRFQ